MTYYTILLNQVETEEVKIEYEEAVAAADADELSKHQNDM